MLPKIIFLLLQWLLKWMLLTCNFFKNIEIHLIIIVLKRLALHLCHCCIIGLAKEHSFNFPVLKVEWRNNVTKSSCHWPKLATIFETAFNHYSIEQCILLLLSGWSHDDNEHFVLFKWDQNVPETCGKCFSKSSTHEHCFATCIMQVQTRWMCRPIVMMWSGFLDLMSKKKATL